MRLSCLVLSRLVSCCLVLSCVTLVACFVFLCRVVSCVWRCFSLCACCLSVVLSVVSWLLASVSSLVFPCTCVCRFLVSWLVFRVRPFPGVHRWFCVLFRVPCALVLFVSVSCRLCVSLSVVVFSRLPVGSRLVVHVPWFLGSVFLCLAVAPYCVYFVL